MAVAVLLVVDTGENPHLNRDESFIPVEYQVIFGCLS